MVRFGLNSNSSTYNVIKNTVKVWSFSDEIKFYATYNIHMKNRGICEGSQ